jgi:hypothetical protein
MLITGLKEQIRQLFGIVYTLEGIRLTIHPRFIVVSRGIHRCVLPCPAGGLRLQGRSAPRSWSADA